MELTRDLIALAAVAAIAIGCWWLEPAAALITVGGLLLLGVVWAAGRRRDE